MIKLALMSDSGKMLYIGVPFSNSISADSSSNLHYDIDMTRIGDSAFSTIKSATSFVSTPLPLSALNYLNRREFGHFFHIANSAQDPTITYLLAYFILANSQIDLTTLPTSTYNFPVTNSSFSLTADTYATTGDKLCWGSGV